jgi:shikimate kinase
VKVFVVGAPCAGKTTVARILRDDWGLNAVDMDEEIARLNGGVWPSTISHKKEVLQPQVLDAAVAAGEIILLNSYMQVERAARLRAAGFRVVLLDVDKDELLRRAWQRQVEQGPTNMEWYDWHHANLAALKSAGLIDDVLSGEQPPEDVARALAAITDKP